MDKPLGAVKQVQYDLAAVLAVLLMIGPSTK